MMREAKSRKIVIVITGTPGTGKTSIAKRLAEILGGIHIDVSEYVLKHKLYTEYDEPSRTYIIDEEKVTERLKKLIKESDKSVIIDTHYPEILPDELIDYVFLLRTHPKILEERIRREKKWHERKIKENIMAEILGVVASNILEAFQHDKIYEIDTSNKSVDEVVSIILDVIRGVKRIEPGVRIDWLEKLSSDIIREYGEY